MIPFQQRAYHLVGRLRNRALLRSFTRLCRDAPSVDTAALREIITANAGTEFGRRHGFATLARDPSGWRREVPLHTYDDLAPAIDRMAAGEANVLTAELVHFFAMTSGSTGANKLIPTPPAHQATFTGVYAGLMPAVPALSVPGGEDPHRGLALLSAAGTQHRTTAGIPVGSASSGGLRRVRSIAPLLWTSPWPVFELEDVASQWYLHALFALRERTLRFLWAVFAPHLVEWLRMIETRREDLIRDIADGRCALPHRMDRLDRLRPDPVRARELEAALAHGFDGFAPRAWPHLRYAMAVITGSFAPYVPRLRRYLGTTPIYTTCYASSEAMIGLNLEVASPERYVLMPGTAHFEFIPISEAHHEQPETVGIDSLDQGRSYEVVLTNRGGLYRYRLRDVVTVVNWYHRSPVLSFQWRQGTILDLAGEKCTEEHLLRAVQLAVERTTGRADTLRDYTVRAETETSPPRYVVYVELEGGGTKADALERALEVSLAEVNPSFGGFRHGHRLGAPRVCVLPVGTFRELASWRLERSAGVSAAQLKPSRLVLDPDLRSWLDERHVPAS